MRYRVGLPVNSTLDWKAYRFGYEYDFVRTNRGFVGFILEVEVHRRPGHARQPTPLVEFARARGPIPAIGGIARVYVGAEHLDHRRGHRLQAARQAIEDNSGHYIDSTSTAR